MLRGLSLLALSLACLTVLPSCIVKTTVGTDNLNVAAGSTFKFGNVVMAPAVMDTATERQSSQIENGYEKWVSALGQRFDKQADKSDIGGDGQPVRATVTAFNPGNRWLRWVWGYSRKAWATATIEFDCGAAGSFTMDGVMRYGWWMGGSPKSLFGSMGRSAAKHLAKKN
ncbi:MAG: hypothetical protein AAF581_04735 [Planctomycetota bacterium]